VEIWDVFSLLCSMRSSFLSESPCDEQHIHGYGFNPQSWLQVERGKLPKSSYSPSSM